MIWLGIAAAVLSAAQTVGQAPGQTSRYEYDVKAVFLYNFTKYLEWPNDDKSEVFTIVVLGESDIIAPLQEIAKKKTVGPTPIAVRPCSEIGEIGRPRILFIANSAVAKIDQVLEKTEGTDILTIGEAEGLGSRGVAVNFVLREGTVKFEMSEKALKKTGILISSQLLRLAILIDSQEAKGDR